MYLMCGPRQLFFQDGTEIPKGWTHLAGEVGERKEPSFTAGGNVNWCSHYGK